VEIARRAVPVHVRPSFKEVEDACRAAKSGATSESEAVPAAAAAAAQ
jgi:hypothetical protein